MKPHFQNAAFRNVEPFPFGCLAQYLFPYLDPKIHRGRGSLLCLLFWRHRTG